PPVGAGPEDTVRRVDERKLLLDALALDALDQVRDRNNRSRGAERSGIPEDRQHRDHPAVAPADDPDALAVDFRISFSQYIDRRHHIVDLRAAVIDGVEMLL